MIRRTAILALAAFGALWAAGPAAAQLRFAQQDFDLRQNYTADQARDAQRGGEVIQARQAIMIAQSQYPGSEYLDLFLSGGDQPVYTVRLKTADGRRVEVVLDARTGAVLRRN